MNFKNFIFKLKNKNSQFFSDTLFAYLFKIFFKSLKLVCVMLIMACDQLSLMKANRKLILWTSTLKALYIIL